MLPKNINLDYTIGPNLNGHNSLNINTNHTNVMFKLKPRMSTFHYNKPHSKLICDSKVMIKIVRKMSFFSIIFKVI